LLKEKLKVKLLSSLSKVFADEDPNESQWEAGSMLSNEVYSFQAAYYWSDLRKKNVQVRINSEILPGITIRSIDPGMYL
jgi:ABC-type molybdate transport system ATPase subunit